MIDPGLPPGGLQSVFSMYDRIVSHHVPGNAPAPEAKPPAEDEKPPWSEPPPVMGIANGGQTEEQKDARVKENLGSTPTSPGGILTRTGKKRA